MFYRDGLHDDAPALQALLDRCGIVVLDQPGTYLVSRTLIIHSNTHLLLSPGAKLLAAPLSRCALIENEHFAGGGRDENIFITGGIWDGNCDSMGLNAVYEAEHREDEPYSPALFKGKLIRFARVDNLVLEKMTVRDPVSYGIQIADACGFVTRDLCFDYNCHFGTTDGVHINGPARDGVIENLRGTTNDDMVSLTTIDELHAEVTKGHIENIEIRNISAKNGYSGVRLLSAGDYEIRNVRICGVYGEYRHNAVLISQHGTRPGTRTWFDEISVEHVHAAKCPTPLDETCFTYWENGAIETLPVVWIEEGIQAGTVTLRDISRHETAQTRGALVQLDRGAKLRRLVAEHIRQTLAPGVTAPLLLDEADIDERIEADIQLGS